MANKWAFRGRSLVLTKAQTRTYENTGPVGDDFRREAKSAARDRAQELGKSVEIYSDDGITFEDVAPEPGDDD